MPQHATNLEPSPTRVEALDALRAGAMLLGVLLHACVPYMHAPMRGLLMPVNQPAADQLIDGVFWSIHTFRMPLFFFISGLVSVAAIRRRGVSRFISGRWRRVGLPLLIGAPTLLVAFYPIWLWGWIERGWTTWRQFRRLKQNIHVQADAWGLYHFWFLEYLLIYGVGLWLVWVAWERLRSSRARWTRVDSDVSTPSAGSSSNTREHRGVILWVSAVVVAVFPLAMLLKANPQLFTEFHNSFLPDPALLAYYAIFYALGCFCRLSWIGTLSKAWAPLLLIGAASTAWVVAMLLGRVEETAEGLVQATIDAGTERRKHRRTNCGGDAERGDQQTRLLDSDTQGRRNLVQQSANDEKARRDEEISGGEHNEVRSRERLIAHAERFEHPPATGAAGRE